MYRCTYVCSIANQRLIAMYAVQVFAKFVVFHKFIGRHSRKYQGYAAQVRKHQDVHTE